MTSWDECSYYETLLTCGRLPWLCNIYIGLALRDAFGSFCVFQFMYGLMCLHLSVLNCCIYVLAFLSILNITFLPIVASRHNQRNQSNFSQVDLLVWGISLKF